MPTRRPAEGPAAGPVRPEDPPEPLSSFLIRRLKRFPTCSAPEHQKTDTLTAEHRAVHEPNEVSAHCGSLRDIAQMLWSRPSQPQGAAAPDQPQGAAAPDQGLQPLPNVLDSNRLGLREYPLDLNCCIAFEGFDARVPGSTPPRLCMSTQHGRTTQTSEDFFTSFDVDSVCAFSNSLAACRQGIRWYPDMYVNLNITANVHLGLSVPPDIASADNAWEIVPLHTVPHYAFGHVEGWDAMTVYFFFPRLHKHHHHDRAKPLERTVLSADQFSLWYDAVLMPAILEVTMLPDANGDLVPDPNIAQHLPQSSRAAGFLTTAPAEMAARVRPYDAAATDAEGGGVNPQRQRVGFPLKASIIQQLNGILALKIRQNPECQPLFSDFVVYLACKNTKLQFMASGAQGNAAAPNSFPAVSEAFLEHWDRCIDDAFLDPARVFVDLGKQVTAASTALPLDDITRPASTFLYRNCCLQAAVDDRHLWLSRQADEAAAQAARERQGSRSPAPPTPPPPSPSPSATPPPPTPPPEGEDQEADDDDGGRWVEHGIARGRSLFNHRKRRKIEGKFPKPLVTHYAWAMTEEIGGMTITSVPRGADLAGGLVYSQYYNLIKAPFDAQKVYALQPPVYENLAIDPLYLRQLRQAGRASIADQAALKRGYLLAKQRAALNLRECVNRSFGIREEHRISLALFRQIQAEWETVEPTPAREPLPLPWFSVPTTDLIYFLRGQINRHCLLFEYILGRTGPMFTLAETVPMVIALRGLRFCYGSNALFREPVLFGEEWTQREWTPREVLEQDREENPEVDAGDGGPRLVERSRVGMGMRRTMQLHGFGWWRPRCFQWQLWRFQGTITRRLLVGNLLLHAEYRRRWKAVRNVRNTQVQLLQAHTWFQDHALQTRPDALATWLDYLHCLVIRQFDLDVWHEVHAQNKKYEELIPTAATQRNATNPPAFTWDEMYPLFYDRGVGDDETPCGPHVGTGNKLKITDPRVLIEFLFEWRDRKQRRGWSARNYRVLTQRIFAMILHSLGEEAAQAWLGDLFNVVLLTRWILPYPTADSFFSFTKSNERLGQYRRIQWFSSVYYGEKLESWIDTYQLERTAEPGTKVSIRHSGTKATFLLRLLILDEMLFRFRDDHPQLNNAGAKWLVQQLRAFRKETEETSGESNLWAVGKATHQRNGIPFIPLVEGGDAPQLVHYHVIKDIPDFDELDTWFSRQVDRRG